MVTKKKSVKMRETKENVFNILKTQAPNLFGSKVWTNVKDFITDPDDTSKLVIEFNEEVET